MNRFAYICLTVLLAHSATAFADGKLLTARDLCREQSLSVAAELNRLDGAERWAFMQLGDGSGNRGVAGVELSVNGVEGWPSIGGDTLDPEDTQVQGLAEAGYLDLWGSFVAVRVSEAALVGATAEEVARAATMPGTRKFSNVTLKRGIISSAAAPVAYLQAVFDSQTGELAGGCAVVDTARLKELSTK